MKITRFRGDLKTQVPSELDAVAEEMRSAEAGVKVNALRQVIAEGWYGGWSAARKREIPILVPGVYLRRCAGVQKWMGYNGLVLLEMNGLASQEEAEALREKLAKCPESMLVCVGSSGRSVKLLVRYALPDGGMPGTEERARLFHAHAYRDAVLRYRRIPGCVIDLKEPRVERGFRLSYDPSLHYNPSAVVTRIEQPLREPEVEMTHRECKAREDDPLLRLMPGLKRGAVIARLFEQCLNEALDKADRPVDREEGDYKPLVCELARNCFRSGIPEEEAVRWTFVHLDGGNRREELAAVIRNVYKCRKGFGAAPCWSKVQLLTRQLEEFLHRRYDVRYNTMKRALECREYRSLRFEFAPLDERMLMGICVEANREGIEAWDKDVKRYLGSDLIPPHSPLDDFLCDLPEWDGEDYIRRLARQVPCGRTDWEELFHKWFLSMVAHWQNPGGEYANSVSPLLTGGQGCGKSTWCRKLLPPELREYYTDSMDFGHKRRAELSLTRFALINIDEFDSITESQQAYLKHILQKPVVQTAAPYQSVVQSYRRYASFIGTSNNSDLLADPTGSRRFICVEVTGDVDTSPVDYAQLYAQALYALRRGYRYWYTRDEERRIMEENVAFEQLSLEEQLFHRYFRAPEGDEKGARLTASEILEVFEKKAHYRTNRSGASRLGRILRSKLKLESLHTKRGTVYELVKI